MQQCDRNVVAQRQTHKANGTSIPNLTWQDRGRPALPQPGWLEGGQPEVADLQEAYSHSLPISNPNYGQQQSQ